MWCHPWKQSPFLLWKSSVQTTARSILQVPYKPVCKVRFYEHGALLTGRYSKHRPVTCGCLNTSYVEVIGDPVKTASLAELGTVRSRFKSRKWCSFAVPRIRVHDNGHVGLPSSELRGIVMGGPTNRSDHFVQRSCQDIVSIWDNFDPTDHVNATALNQASPQVGRIATYEIEKSMKMSERRTEHRQYCIIKANTIY